MKDLLFILALSLLGSIVFNTGPIGRFFDKWELRWRLYLGAPDDDGHVVRLRKRLKLS